MSPLRWTCKSTRRIAEELMDHGYSVSHTKVGQLLASLHYSLQSIRKKMEGKSHPDRDAQFKFINGKVIDFQSRQQPVISVDAKKKELIGRFANSGQEYQPTGNSEEVVTYDFPSMADGKGIPYGIYDMTRNQGWVSVGTDHDTAQFAVHSIRQWWYQMGRTAYPEVEELLITTRTKSSAYRQYATAGIHCRCSQVAIGYWSLILSFQYQRSLRAFGFKYLVSIYSSDSLSMMFDRVGEMTPPLPCLPFTCTGVSSVSTSIFW